jgi:hypothetical protein
VLEQGLKPRDFTPVHEPVRAFTLGDTDRFAAFRRKDQVRNKGVDELLYDAFLPQDDGVRKIVAVVEPDGEIEKLTPQDPLPIPLDIARPRKGDLVSEEELPLGLFSVRTWRPPFEPFAYKTSAIRIKEKADRGGPL